MKEIAAQVFQIPVFPRHAINTYLIGSIIVDAGVRSSASVLRKALGARTLEAHVLTHAHADHQGASAFLCAEYEIPLWCGEHERTAAETGNVTQYYPRPRHPISRLQQRFWAGPGHPVARVLREGDIVGDFRVIETPGHARGHIALWRERDRVLLAGDVLVNMDLITTRVGLREPPALFTSDIAQNRQSIRKLADLRPEVVCFGHGPVLYDTEQLQELAARLPKPY